ncbi:glycosyltransferase family 39 protein [Candidatus Microgenomates bacterium]|nr:glycosyltransferase family 39 protein [Candidatus Microgenomates bacterium]
MWKKITLGNKWPLFIILLIAGLLLAINLDKPFWGHHDWTGVYWGSVARNFSRYGLVATKFGMVLGSGALTPDQFSYNFHYLPLFPIIWSGFFAVFGIHNWVSRLMPLVFSLGSLAIFYQLITRYFSRQVAIFACLFWIATPMFIYFGKTPIHEIPLMFFVLAALYYYLGRRYKLLLLFILLAELTTWPGFFLVPAITIHWWLRGRKQFTLVRVVTLWAASVGLFLLHLAHDYWLTGSPLGGGLGEIFLSRVQGVAIVPYLSVLVRWAVTYYTLLLPMSFLWLILAIKKKLPGRQDIPALFLIFAVFYPLIFRDASIRHDFLLIYFWPFLALSSALVVGKVIRSRLIQIPAVIVILSVMIVTRFKYIVALENSDIYKESVRFGQFIHDNSSLTDKVLAVTADSTVGWDGWFIAYYADRVVVQEATLPSNLKNFDKVMIYSSGGRMSAGVETKSNGIK